MNPYHRWLIKHRIWCEHVTPHSICTYYATKVINKNGHDYCYCDFHGYQPKPKQLEIKPK